MTASEIQELESKLSDLFQQYGFLSAGVIGFYVDNKGVPGALLMHETYPGPYHVSGLADLSKKTFELGVAFVKSHSGCHIVSETENVAYVKKKDNE
jgi:hypothetical protein